jgi:hypothetical protein
VALLQLASMNRDSTLMRSTRTRSSGLHPVPPDTTFCKSSRRPDTQRLLPQGKCVTPRLAPHPTKIPHDVGYAISENALMQALGACLWRTPIAGTVSLNAHIPLVPNNARDSRMSKSALTVRTQGEPGRQRVWQDRTQKFSHTYTRAIERHAPLAPSGRRASRSLTASPPATRLGGYRNCLRTIRAAKIRWRSP